MAHHFIYFYDPLLVVAINEVVAANHATNNHNPIISNTRNILFARTIRIRV